MITISIDDELAFVVLALCQGELDADNEALPDRLRPQLEGLVDTLLTELGA